MNCSLPTCMICGSKHWSPLHQRGAFSYLKCAVCGVETTNPPPTGQQIADYYKSKNAGDSYNTRVKFDRKDTVHADIFKWTVDALGRRPKYVLDVGCLDGRLLDYYRDAGAKTHGVEIQADAQAIANEKHGGRIFRGTVEEFAEHYKGPRFDLITAIAVIEHVPDPVSFLKAMSKLIADDGALVIETPTPDSAIRTLMRSWWPAYIPIEHIYLISKKGMRLALDKSGYEISKSTPHWKTLELEYFYLMTATFMPYLYRWLKMIVPYLPKALMSIKVPMYAGDFMLMARPTVAHSLETRAPQNHEAIALSTPLLSQSPIT